jgi:hypothetical protein
VSISVRVLIGGMIKSGSTFTFNAAREILSASGKVATSAADSFESWIDESKFQHFITKSHIPNAKTTEDIREGIVKSICTIRRPEDAIASFNRTFGRRIEQSTRHVCDWLGWYSSVFIHALTIEFDLIEAEPESAVMKIDKFLTGSCDRERAARIAASYEKSKLKESLDALEENSNTVNIGFSYYDKNSFFHRRHISSLAPQSAEDCLTREQLAHIRDNLKGFVDLSGQLKPISAWDVSESHELATSWPTS